MKEVYGRYLRDDSEAQREAAKAIEVAKAIHAGFLDQSAGYF